MSTVSISQKLTGIQLLFHCLQFAENDSTSPRSDRSLDGENKFVIVKICRLQSDENSRMEETLLVEYRFCRNIPGRPRLSQQFLWSAVQSSSMRILIMRCNDVFNLGRLQLFSEDDWETPLPDGPLLLVEDCLGSRRKLIAICAVLRRAVRILRPVDEIVEYLQVEFQDSDGDRFFPQRIPWFTVKRWTVKGLLSHHSEGRPSSEFRLFLEDNPYEALYSEAILQHCLNENRIVMMRHLPGERPRVQNALQPCWPQPQIRLLPPRRHVWSRQVAAPRAVRILDTTEVTTLIEAVEQTEDLGQCTICLNSLIETDDAELSQVSQIKSCKHVFHTKCITDWLHSKRAATCPLCRSAVATRMDS